MLYAPLRYRSRGILVIQVGRGATLPLSIHKRTGFGGHVTSEPQRTTPVLDRKQLRWAWVATALIVLIFGYGITDWTEIAETLAEGTAEVLAFTAGYTLPLTAGTGVSTGLILYNRRSPNPMDDSALLALVGVILIAAGLAASYLGLGLAPEFTWVPNAPLYIALPLMALMGYFNSYGWPLMLCSAAIGITSALHLDYWRSNPFGIVDDLAQ